MLKIKENTYLVKDPFHSHPFIRTVFLGWKKSCDVSVFHTLLQSQFFDTSSRFCPSTHLYITISSMTTMKDIAVKGLPTALDLRALSVASSGNSTRNPFIQFCRAAWSNYSWPEDQVFHCSPCFTYLSTITLFRWTSPALLKNWKKRIPKRKLISVFSTEPHTVIIFTLW